MQLTSLSLALTRAGFLSFSPASLFAAGEPGVWYEPSLTNGTCFQDSSGTTPVTAVEQPVGLILDKSKGLVLGPELVTNGDFSNGTTGWSSSTIYTSTSSVVDGVFRVNNTTNYGLQLQPISCVVGRAYVITGQARRGTVLSAAIGASANANGSAAIALATTTSDNFVALRCQFVATSTTMYVVLGGSAANSSGYHEYDNISVREIAGNHATQTTSTSRPVLSARYNLLTKTEQFDDAVWSKNSVTNPTATTIVETTAANNEHNIYAPIASAAAATYTFSVECALSSGTRYAAIQIATNNADNSTGRYTVVVDLSDGSVKSEASGAGTTGKSKSVTSTGSGKWRISVSAAHSSGTVYGVIGMSNSATPTYNAASNPTYTGDGTSGIYIWGASLVPANQADLPYQRVNTATDYDADPSKFKPYLCFDGVDDWLVTPTITPGVDKAQVFAGVRKLSDAATQCLLESSASAASNAGSLLCSFEYYDATFQNVVRDYLRGSVIASKYSTIGNAPSTIVRTSIFDISQSTTNTEISQRVNGSIPSPSNVTAASAGTGNFLAYPLYIGRRGGTTLPFNGHLYGLIVRFGANLPAGTIASTETWLNGKTGAY